jgi:hypothetical protein
LADGGDNASFLAASCKVLAFNNLLLIGLSTNSFKTSSDFNAVYKQKHWLNLNDMLKIKITCLKFS